jgi:DMSO/TMAO reductase YedYZ molybdopterin-dependent catalytic subunit
MEIIRRMRSTFGVRGIPEGMHDRVPKGQYVTPKMPVMNLSYAPKLSTADWKLSVRGLVEREVELDWDAFLALPGMSEVVDFHCVTQWSRLNVAWEGVAASTVVDLASPKPEARYVMLRGADGYTTNVDLEMFREPDVLFAHKMDGEPLEPNHGYPVRLVVPARYGWKSAKWVTGVELMAENRPGFWETNGYHMRGDPWREERFSHA